MFFYLRQDIHERNIASQFIMIYNVYVFIELFPS